MHIFLYGPPGTGKSTVGKLLARDLNRPFVDLDAVIESRACLSIPKIMEQSGETAFRSLETAALQESMGQSLTGGPVVIALGGGALLRQENRSLAESHGRIVLLTAGLPTLLERLKSDPEQRPLLAGELPEKLASLLARRREHYGSFPLQLDAGQPPEVLSQQIQTALGRFHLSAMGEYDVIVGPVGRTAGPSHLIVTDENVAGHHLESVKAALLAAGTAPATIVLPAGEQHKNLDGISRLWEAFLENGLDRRSTVTALGGGVVSDMTGFAASTYMRGIRWTCLPTTLLSMVDASLGGKTGFDLPQGKNLVGAFHPPGLVLADPQFLQTLPHREFISGMAEVVKHGIISDPELFHLCARGPDWIKTNLEQVVKHAMAVKIRVIEEDPYERGRRAALNLGHTVGHAVELASRFELRHGEAVAIGMVAEARFAERTGVAEPGLSTTIAEMLSGLGLPVEIPGSLARGEILRAMRVDKKKNAAGIRFALPVAIGKVELVEVTNLDDVL